MKQLIEKTKKPLWFVEKSEKKIVINISDIKKSMKRRKRFAPISIRIKNETNT